MNRSKLHWITRRTAAASLGALLAMYSSLSQAAPAPAKAGDLFKTTNIWSIHFTFTPEQWTAMEPKNEGGGPGFGPPRAFGPPGGGGPGRGGPGMGGPGGPGPGGFGPAMFLAPAFMQAADENKDAKISSAEFDALARKWFTTWDTNKSGKIDNDQLRAGLNGSFMPPGMRGPGGPGGPGRMNLQGPEGHRNGIAARMGVDFNYVHADMQFEDQHLPDVAARYKGNGTYLESRMSGKRSIKVDLNKYNKGQKFAGLSTLNLHNNITDASWMNEPLSFRLYRDAGVPAPRTAYARVHVTAPPDRKNDYIGLYSIVENVDSAFTKHHFHEKDGAIFKPVTPDLFSDLGNDWAKYKQTYDPKDDPTPEETARVIETCRFVTSSTDAEFAAHIADYIDLPEFASYMAVTVYLSDLDGILGPGQNFYLYLHPTTKKFIFIPWDQDHSFGQMRGSQEDREQLSIQQPWQGENRFLERIYKVEAFKKMYLAKLAEFNTTLFRPERLQAQVDQLAPILRPAVKEESEDRLNNFDAAISGKMPAARFGPFGSAKPIKTFVTARTASVTDQLAGKSQGNRVGEGFGPGPGPRGPGGPGGRGPGGPGGGFGPGMFLGGPFMSALDADHDGHITEAEMTQGFKKWFQNWNTDKSGLLTEDQLRAGLAKDLIPSFGGEPPR